MSGSTRFSSYPSRAAPAIRRLGIVRRVMADGRLVRCSATLADGKPCRYPARDCVDDAYLCGLHLRRLVAVCTPTSAYLWRPVKYSSSSVAASTKKTVVSPAEWFDRKLVWFLVAHRLGHMPPALAARVWAYVDNGGCRHGCGTPRMPCCRCADRSPTALDESGVPWRSTRRYCPMCRP